MLTAEKVALDMEGFALRADFSVAEGARVAVIGPSGAGKSTLLDVIAGFLRPDTGRILWKGRDLTDLPPAARPISILFQDNNLFPHLSVAQNVGLGLRPDLKLSAGQKAAVTRGLDRVGLTGFEGRRPGELSGGQRSRAALARVLVGARPVVLLDEPFAALGPALKAEMLDLVRDVVDEIGATLLMVSHDPRDARTVAGQTMLVVDGKVSPPRDTEELLDDPPPALRAYLG